jgi:hypothetical protein
MSEASIFTNGCSVAGACDHPIPAPHNTTTIAATRRIIPAPTIAIENEIPLSGQIARRVKRVEATQTALTNALCLPWSTFMALRIE